MGTHTPPTPQGHGPSPGTVDGSGEHSHCDCSGGVRQLRRVHALIYLLLFNQKLGSLGPVFKLSWGTDRDLKAFRIFVSGLI